MLFNLVDQLGPIFLLVAMGFGLAKIGLVERASIEGLTKMTFWALIPATLFVTISGNRVSELFNLSIWLAYYGAVAMTAISVFVLLRMGKRNTTPEAIVLAFGAIFSNIGMLGIPVVDILFGHEGLLVLATILCIHAIGLLTPTILLLEWTRNRNGNPAAIIGKTLRAQVCNPIIVAILCGVIVASFDIPMPQFAMTFLGMLKAAMPPIALMLIGAGIYGQKLRGNLATSITGAIAKVCLMPGLVFVIGMLLHIPMQSLAPAIIIAALPPGVNSVLMASTYETASERTATTMLVATVLSLIILPALAVVLAFD